MEWLICHSLYVNGTSGKAAREWAMVLDTQRGIASRAEAQRAGFTRKAIRHRLGSGQWRRVRRGVYATFTGELSREARLWAAVRRAGPGAMLSHETAAELQGVIEKPSAKIHVTVPSRRRPAQKKPIHGVVVHRSDQSRAQYLPPWVLPRTRIEDTILDLVAAARSFDAAYSWVARATFRGLVTAAQLRTALAARTRIRWRAWLTDALAEAADGVQSPLELRYARDVERAHGLPKAQRQARREIAGKAHYRDNWYPEFRVCVEIDGPAYHQNDQVGQDKRRDNLNLAADDVRTFRFGPVEVTELACESAAMVTATLKRNGWRGSPRPCRRSACTLRRTPQTRDTSRPQRGTSYPTSLPSPLPPGSAAAN